MAVAIAAAAPLVLAPVAAQAATKPAHQLVALAGSGHYLVYSQHPVSPSTGRMDASGKVTALDSAGHRHALGSFKDTADVRYSLSGSTLVRLGSPARWWNLDTHQTGTLPTSPDETIVTAAPAGWVTFNRQTSTLTQHYLDARTPIVLGDPLTDDPNDGGATVFTVGPKAVIFTDSTGRIRSFTFGQTGYRELAHFTWGGASPTIGCASTNTTITTCGFFSEINGATKVYGLPLNGAARFSKTTTDDITAGPVALGKGLLWIDKRGHAKTLQPTGKTSTSKAVFTRRSLIANVGIPIAAFGRAILTDKAGTRLLALSSATSTPRVLIKTY